MAINIFRPEDKLQGSTNYNSWKARLTTILEENDLDDIVFNIIEEPTSNAGKVAYKKKQAKARRIIYDSMKETFMPNITALNTTKECFDTLTNLCEKKAPSQKRVLNKRLRTLKMNKDEGVGPFFTKIVQVRDQLIAIVIAVDDDDLVQIVVDGLPRSCENFMASIYGRENQQTFERLWDDCIEEEGRTSGKVIKPDNLALVAKTKKFKKPFPQQKKGKKPQGKFSNMSKIECYTCHKFGHYAR